MRQLASFSLLTNSGHPQETRAVVVAPRARLRPTHICVSMPGVGAAAAVAARGMSGKKQLSVEWHVKLLRVQVTMRVQEDTISLTLGTLISPQKFSNKRPTCCAPSHFNILLDHHMPFLCSFLGGLCEYIQNWPDQSTQCGK